MSAAETPLHLSPSEFHRHLLERMVPKLRYEGGQGGHRFYAEEAWPVMLEELARLGGKKTVASEGAG